LGTGREKTWTCLQNDSGERWGGGPGVEGGGEVLRRRIVGGCLEMGGGLSEKVVCGGEEKKSPEKPFVRTVQERGNLKRGVNRVEAPF